MNKKLLFFLLLGILVLPVSVYAAVNSIQSLSVAIAGVVWIVFTVIVIICFVAAGILFLTAAGSAEKVAKARSAFLWGIVGVAVGIVAYSIITLLSRALS